MLNQKDILSTIEMIDQHHLDIRTITMGISLLDCAIRTHSGPVGKSTIKLRGTRKIW